jgi:tyrosyl-tRNA synthetase
VIGENNNALGITINLLTDANGVKFGKSTGGGAL